MTSKITPPLKYHGSKVNLSNEFWNLRPENYLHRVHAFGGAFNEAWNWPTDNESVVYNDVNYLLTNFFRVLQDKSLFDEFVFKAKSTPFSQEEWRDAQEYINENFMDCVCGEIDIDIAHKFFVLCRQSLAGRCKSFAPLTKNRLRKKTNEQISAWLNVVDGLYEVHEKLMQVVILNDDAMKVIQREDSDNTWFILDPPYVPETRTSPDVYQYEMSYEQHEDLLNILLNVNGSVLLCGYANDLYDSWLKSWRRVTFDRPNNASSAKSKRRMTEVVWMNYGRF